MLQAAQLALATPGSPRLIAKDTGGTPEGAAAAAQAALAEGASLILGPLTSGETAAVAPIAPQADVAVLAFTNDPAQAQPGVWTLGITPAQQVRRLVAAATAQGKTGFAGLLPDTGFGHALGNALVQTTSAASVPSPAYPLLQPRHGGRERGGQGDRRLRQPARADRGQDPRRAGQGTPEGRQEAQELAKSPVPPPPFNALLLGDTGETLSEIASLLPYYDIDRSQVQILGPALWSSPSSGAAQFSGAWYAALGPGGAARVRAGLCREIWHAAVAALRSGVRRGLDRPRDGRQLQRRGADPAGGLRRRRRLAGPAGRWRGQAGPGACFGSSGAAARWSSRPPHRRA